MKKAYRSTASIWLRRMIAALICLILMLATGCIGWLIGMSQEYNRLTGNNSAEFALKSTGLPATYAPSFCLHGYTGFRDRYAQTEFRIDSLSDRTAVFDAISSSDNWHIAPVNVSEYAAFANSVMWGYEKAWQYSDEIIFDAWYYYETTEPHAPNNRIPNGPMKQIGSYAGRGFEFALYDADTGLFIYIDQFG